MSSLPFEVFARHRGYRLPYPLRCWHLPEEREESVVSEDFKPSEFDQVNLILYRREGEGEISLSIEGTPYKITLGPGENYKELAAWTPPNEEDAEVKEGLWGRAGLYRIRAAHEAQAWVTTIEVQPHYLSFEQMGRMCADIERLSTWVAYDILPYAPTVGGRIPRSIREDGADEDPAVQLALLKETVPEALRTLRFLAASPHLALKPTYVATRSGGGARQDRRSMRLEERLNERDEGWTVQRTGELTYDIYENRFVKRLLMDLHRRLGHLHTRFTDALDELERQEDEIHRRLRRQYGDQEERILREEPLWTRPLRNRRGGLHSQIVACGRMRDALAAVLRTDLMREVPPLRGIVRPTNVLQHDPQYSRLWAIYRLLRLSDRGDTSMAHRFHRRSRPSWELYEMWTAVQVMEACMRDLRFTRVISQTVSQGTEEEVTFMYDTPRPAVIHLAHETEPVEVEIIYGGFIPMSEGALMAHRRSQKGVVPESIVELPEVQEGDSVQEEGTEFDVSGMLNGSEPVNEAVAEKRSSDIMEIEEANPAVSAPLNESEGSEETPVLFDGADEGGHSPVDVSLFEDAEEESLLVTRGVQTAPDLQVRFFDSESGELLGVLILDAKYKAGRRLWGREGGRTTNDRLALESYLLDIHRRDREEAALALFSQPADDIVLGAYALYPGERFGRDLNPEERQSKDGRLGAVIVNPDAAPQEELSHVLMRAMTQAQLRQNLHPVEDGGR